MLLEASFEGLQIIGGWEYIGWGSIPLKYSAPEKGPKLSLSACWHGFDSMWMHSLPMVRKRNRNVGTYNLRITHSHYSFYTLWPIFWDSWRNISCSIVVTSVAQLASVLSSNSPIVLLLWDTSSTSLLGELTSLLIMFNTITSYAWNSEFGEHV